jgi:hypothetical protein
VDPTDLSSAGWAVVFAKNTPTEVRDALEPLIAHRRSSIPPDRCKVLEYKPGQNREDWLGSHRANGYDVEPDRMPYYLLLVGTPRDIPFEFQYLLDIDYGVGRLAFATPGDYGRYAESVVAYEAADSVPNDREVAFWGTRHQNDGATALSCDHLIAPLHEGLPATDGGYAQPPFTERLGYRARCFKGKDATRANLLEMLHGREARQAVLVTASHGLGWPIGHSIQQAAQGGLVCQDWPGVGSIARDHYLTASDVTDDARVLGLVAFFFATYGAGSPAFDAFLANSSRGPMAVADEPFVAALPQRLLSHPQGAALAVVGHVERAWGYSVRPTDRARRLLPFRNFLGRVLAGEPVGHATKDFSERYAMLSVELLNKLDAVQPGPRPTDRELVGTWVERNDGRSYCMLGDPAVRLRNDLIR